MVARRVSVRSSQEPECAQWVTLHTGGFEKANGEENKTHVRCEPELLHTCLAHASPWAMESPKQNGKAFELATVLPSLTPTHMKNVPRSLKVDNIGIRSDNRRHVLLIVELNGHG